MLYGSSSDSRWHECGHGTAFKTRWMNDVVYQVACFMILREPTVWRWSHTRHHTDTIIVGRDPEIAVPRPPDLLAMFAEHLRPARAAHRLSRAGPPCLRPAGAEEATFIPEMERRKVYLVARIYLAIHRRRDRRRASLGTHSAADAMSALPTLLWRLVHDHLLRPHPACRASPRMCSTTG